MSQYPIAVIVGSLRRDSFNRKLADAMVKLAPAEFSFAQVNIGDLPLYNQDNDGAPPPSVIRLKAEIAAAKAAIYPGNVFNPQTQTQVTWPSEAIAALEASRKGG